jgi:ADP-heptose:LPS heptosyltransferase
LAPNFATGHDQRIDLMFAIEMQQHEAGPFDMIIVPRWPEDLHGAGIIAQTVDAPYRISYAANVHPNKAEKFFQDDNYYTHVIEEPRDMHEVWRGMQMLHALGLPMPPLADIKQEIHTTPEDAEKIAALLVGKDLPRPWIAFGIGAAAPFKCWPGEHFAGLAQQILASHHGTIFLIGGGKQDTIIAAMIAANHISNVINLVGQLSIRESAVLISQCNAMVCNDSFTLHAAATHGVPIVEIIGQPADGDPASEYYPKFFGPWGSPFAVIQPTTCQGSKNLAADFRGEPKCIADVPPDDVFITLTEVMQRWPK